MELYLGVMSIIFFGLCKSNQYKNICGTERGLVICCSSYYLVNGECIVCPSGSFGVNCSKPCPKGFFGEACENPCDCLENEVCDAAYGCSGNTTDGISIPLSSAELTTVLHHTKASTELPAVPLFLYPVSVGCISFFFITCLMIIHRTVKRTRGTIKPNNPSTPPTSPPPIPPLQSGRQDIPLDGVPTVHAKASGSDYAEIRECNPTYSSCAEASSIYNVLSFSRSKYRSEIFNTASGIYSTSKSCSLQKKEAMKLEAKLDETDNTKLGPTDLVDVTEMDGNGEANISQKQQI